MFLKPKKTHDDGAALIVVIGLAAVIMIFVGVTGSLIVGALHFSDTTRASVQAQAAGQAGIAVVAADLTKSTCALPYTHSTTPVYSVTVSYQRTASGTTWIPGCPSTAPDVTKVKIVAVGTGTAFQPVKKTVESIFNYIPAVTPPGITTSGSAIYGYNELDGTITNLKITQQGSADKPGIEFKSGNAKCQTGGVIEGDVILGNGAYNSPSGCTINGDLWASQTVAIGNNSIITGSVHAAGTANPTVSVAGGAAVNGNIYSAGPVSIGGNVGGNIITGPTGGQSNITATVGGSVVSAGTVKVSNGGSVAGGITQNKTGITAPTAPTVPSWVDFNYVKTDWVDGNGVPFVEVKPTTCTAAAIAAALNTAAETIVNTLTSPCGGGQVNLTGTTLSLQADTVLVANSFELKNMTITSAAGLSGPQRRLWIITPDVLADGQPTCNSPESQSQIDNQVQFDKSVAVFIYTPCGLSNSGSELWGQLYTSSITFNNAFVLDFVQMGLPGVNFDNGTYTPPPPPTPGKLSTLFSTRNISG
ncbi:polymer-forming cytoskeletal protein [Diaminobutyricibacter tongyongensis]|uniref:Polymer-forming cytoskeletal protein n=1 Tax=Leifsonia tongyongensis TaxID=1268043 RepID=A0A6L9XSV6_9MICO|nr:polymer-forming cytoskeletal protein [Diaminobutyricibacter tongyongensis]NEN04501.1 polymer-forming cytoskeletal protein [Diaminobutyricibacter tongyongensis]